MRGKALAKGLQCIAVELDGRHRRLTAQLRERLAAKIVRDAVAAVGDLVTVAADAIHADDEREVLDGACAEQRLPRIAPRRWPIGNIQEQVVFEVRPPPAV